MNQIQKTALINAVSTAAYVIAVGSFMYFGSQIKLGRANLILVPISLLLLFVFDSAYLLMERFDSRLVHEI